MALRRRLGSALLHWWEPRSELSTLTGSEVETNAALAGGSNLGARVGSMPLSTSSGPNGRPYIAEPYGAGRLLATMAIAAGNRVGMYTVARYSGVTDGATHFTVNARGAPNTSVQYLAVQASSSAFFASALFTGGAQTATSPYSAGWHLFSILPLSTGASARVDGVPFATTNFTGSDTLVDQNSMQIGNSGTAGGDWACTLMVDLATDAVVRDQAVRDYVRSRFGIAA